MAGVSVMDVQRTRCAPSPHWGEGWGEGVRIYRETKTPHPTPLPPGEGAEPSALPAMCPQLVPGISLPYDEHAASGVKE